MNNPKIGWTVVFVLLVVIGVLLWLLFALPSKSTSTNATSTATTTQSTGDGTSTSTVSTKPVVTAPKSGATVPKTFTVTGQAPGNWFFEASFPVQVLDPSGTVVGQIAAQALSDWMTTDMVPFKADITIANYAGPAILVLKRDNPSGLPQNDDSISLPIVVQ